MKEYSRKDWLLAVLATFIVLIIGAFSLTKGLPDWGDDNAAYINEGISIADGKFKEQTELNFYYHPSDVPLESADSGAIVYVWGYPLLISAIYKIVGFSYGTVIFYKIPSLLSLAFTAGVLVLLIKRRFPIEISFVASLVFCLSTEVFITLNYLISDLLFLFFTCLTFLLMEMLADYSGSVCRTLIIGVLYAVSLWMTYETRLSGFAVVAIAFIAHVIAFIGRTEKTKKAVILNLVPYLLMGVLIVVFDFLVFAPATSNLSDLSSEFDRFVNIIYYSKIIYLYFGRVTGVGYTVFVLFFIGLFRYGFQKKNIYLTVFIIGTMIVNINLPYIQGLRYIFNILPFVFMFAAYGLILICNSVNKLIKYVRSKKSDKKFETKKIEIFNKAVVAVVSVYLVAFSANFAIRVAINNVKRQGSPRETDVYSAEAVEVYDYIKDKTSADSVIAFFKPRSLYLNTGHKSFRCDVNGHELSEADYYLYYKMGSNENLKDDDLSGFDVVLDNSGFTLYQKGKG